MENDENHEQHLWLGQNRHQFGGTAPELLYQAHKMFGEKDGIWVHKDKNEEEKLCGDQGFLRKA